KQRQLERQIRKDKHEVLALREAINGAEDENLKKELEADYVKAAERLTKHNVMYNRFCEENGLKKLSDRINIAKWNRSEAAKARGAAQRSHKKEQIS
ncbi:MAG: phage minor capsid protein, partial [Ruminococcus sp.]|nr:phage minor capsid protein [Ruminococcus sp.]